MQISKRNLIALSLLLVSVVLLIPGLTYDLLTLDISINALISITVYDETRSIIGTISDLFNNGNAIVGILILLFSVVIPVLKAVMMALVVLFKNLPYRNQIAKFVTLISKWSMADVFVVGVFIAFLSLKANENVKAELHQGFWFFVGYCLISITAAQMVQIDNSDDLS